MAYLFVIGFDPQLTPLVLILYMDCDRTICTVQENQFGHYLGNENARTAIQFLLG